MAFEAVGGGEKRGPRVKGPGRREEGEAGERGEGRWSGRLEVGSRVAVGLSWSWSCVGGVQAVEEHP